MVKKDLEKVLVILKLWEEELKIKNDVSEDKVYSKKKNDSLKINDLKCSNTK